MLWCDFYHKLKKLDSRFWVQVNEASGHPHFPWIKICGIHYGNEHIAAITVDSVVPFESDYDEEGVLMHQGLKEVLKRMSRHRRRFGSITKPIASKEKLAKHFGFNPYSI